MYGALEIAGYVVTLCAEEKHPVSNCQLQRLLWHIQKDSLKSGEAAFPNEIEAWPIGPVVPDVYYAYCGNGASPITLPLLYKAEIFQVADRTRVDRIVRERMTQPPWRSMEKDDVRRKGGAWDAAYQDGDGRGSVIPLECIRILG